MSLPPKLTDAQRAAALEKAAHARRVRAEVKEKLRTGDLTFARVMALAAEDEIVAKTKVLSVLEALPGVGKVKARRTMETVGISESRRLRGLGQQQLAGLFDLLGDT